MDQNRNRIQDYVGPRVYLVGPYQRSQPPGPKMSENLVQNV